MSGGDTSLEMKKLGMDEKELLIEDTDVLREYRCVRLLVTAGGESAHMYKHTYFE